MKEIDDKQLFNYESISYFMIRKNSNTKIDYLL